MEENQVVSFPGLGDRWMRRQCEEIRASMLAMPMPAADVERVVVHMQGVLEGVAEALQAAGYFQVEASASTKLMKEVYQALLFEHVKVAIRLLELGVL